MKRTLLLICLAGICSFSFGQSIKFGIEGGVNLSKLAASSSGLTLTSSTLTGFRVGGVVDVGFENFSLQPGLFYSTKGGSYGSASDGGTAKLTLNYVEIPVNLVYNIPVIIGKVFIGAGPYVAMGVSGKGTTTGAFTSSGSGSETENITFGNGPNDTKNPDYGINFMGGVRFKGGFLVSAGYGLGLGNLSNDNSGSIKNRVINISVGYFFL